MGVVVDIQSCVNEVSDVERREKRSPLDRKRNRAVEKKLSRLEKVNTADL